MSSVLKALKKLENEYPSSESNRSWLKESQTGEAFFDRLKASWITHQRLAAVGLFLLLGVAALVFNTGFFKKYGPSAFLEKQTTQTKAAVALSENQPPEKPEVHSEEARLPAAQTPPVIPEQPVVQKRVLENVSLADRDLAAGVPTSPQPAKESPLQSPPGTPAVGNTDRPAASDAAGIPADAGIKILTDSTVKLEALSWSKEPQNRIAVINDRIVRQGSRVDGFAVVRINPDDVILRQGEDLWKIIFRPR